MIATDILRLTKVEYVAREYLVIVKPKHCVKSPWSRLKEVEIIFAGRCFFLNKPMWISHDFKMALADARILGVVVLEQRD